MNFKLVRELEQKGYRYETYCSSYREACEAAREIRKEGRRARLVRVQSPVREGRAHAGYRIYTAVVEGV